LPIPIPILPLAIFVLEHLFICIIIGVKTASVCRTCDYLMGHACKKHVFCLFVFTAHYLLIFTVAELTALQPDEDECKYKKTCATIKTHANTKKHPQIKKNIFISSTTHVCSKYSQHNQIQKRAAQHHCK